MRAVSYLLAATKQIIPLYGMEVLLPSPSPCHIPILLVPFSRMPTIAEHTFKAQFGLYEQFEAQPVLLNYLGYRDRKKSRDACRGVIRPPDTNVMNTHMPLLKKEVKGPQSW